MKKSRVALLVAVIFGSLLIAIPDAHACSCMASDPRDDLNASDGAFIGTYVGREPVDVTDPYADWNYIFETEEVFKGDIGETVEVRAPANGAGCGLEYPEGSPAALFLDREDNLWHSGLCQTVFPDALREAAAPFPVPDAEGPPRLLVGGSFGEVRVIALDAEGRTAGYGYGEGDALYMSLCPGRQRSIEMVGGYRTDEQRSVDVRRLSDLKVETRTLAPQRWIDGFVFPEEAVCTSRNGSAVVFSRGYENGEEYRELTRFQDGAVRPILRTKAVHAALGAKKVFLARHKRLSVMVLRTGQKRLLRVFGRRVSQMALSPDGTRLALTLGAASDAGKLMVLRTEDGKKMARRHLAGSAQSRLTWVRDDSLFLWGSRRSSPLYDRFLQKRSEIRDWYLDAAVRVGCTLYGVGYGTVAEASACEGGSPAVTRGFFSPVTYSLMPLPRGTEINAPPEP